jgi:hypothetical protein
MGQSSAALAWFQSYAEALNRPIIKLVYFCGGYNINSSMAIWLDQSAAPAEISI